MDQGEAKTHTMRALIELRQKIMAGDFEAGMRLLEVSIAEQLQISRTPAREAMSRLVEEGLLERLPNGGFVVRRFTFDDVVDAIELRGVLEGTAARLAAERGVEDERLDEITTIVRDIDACFVGEVEVLFDRYSELNALFHTRLAGLAGSEVIRREVERVMLLPFASPSAFLPDRTDIAAFSRSLRMAQSQHHEMIEAISNREGARAEALARDHARLARRNLDYLMREERDMIGRVPGLALMVE